MSEKRIVIIGAGSLSFGRGMIVDLVRSEELIGRGLSIWLVDVDAEALESMRQFAERVRAHVRSDIEIRATKTAGDTAGATITVDNWHLYARAATP